MKQHHSDYLGDRVRLNLHVDPLVKKRVKKCADAAGMSMNTYAVLVLDKVTTTEPASKGTAKEHYDQTKPKRK